MNITQILAIIATTGFVGMTVFQILLALGFPLGKLSWGGKYTILPFKFRIASFVSAGIFIFAAFIVLEKTEFILFFNNKNLVNYSLWGLTIIFGLSTIGNLTSKSNIEKQIMTPVALTLFLSCLLIAIL